MKQTSNSSCIVFFGTPEFAVPALEALVNAGYKVVVVTQPDKPVGRGLKVEAPPIKVKADELGLKVLQPTTLKTPTTLELFKSLNINLAVCVAYGSIIPKEVLEIFTNGILNIHPSLLPKYRGPSPIQSAILNGDTETGVTIMLLDEEMDHGPTLAQDPHLISPLVRGRKRGLIGGELSKILSQTGAKLLVNTLPKYLAGEIKPQEQDHAKATFTKMLTREDGHIDWNKPVSHIARQIAAYDPWPGTWTTWNGKRLKILRASLLHATIGCANNVTAGYIWKTEEGRLAVNCNPGSIVLETLQLEGKKSMTGEEFLRGYPKFLGSILG